MNLTNEKWRRVRRLQLGGGMRVGVVADNHALVDPAVLRLVSGVDEIWHAGDLVRGELLAELAKIAPVLAVRGNNDVRGEVAGLPEERAFEREGWRFLLRHIVGKPPRIEASAKASIRREHARVVVLGHSHQPLAAEWDGVVFLNPGSCGPRRFRLPRAAALLDVSPGRLAFAVHDLESGAVLLERAWRPGEAG